MIAGVLSAELNGKFMKQAIYGLKSHMEREEEKGEIKTKKQNDYIDLWPLRTLVLVGNSSLCIIM